MPLLLTPALFDDLANRRDVYRLCVSLEEIADLAAGVVPRVVKAMCLAELDWDDHLRRQAEAPVKKRGKR